MNVEIAGYVLDIVPDGFPEDDCYRTEYMEVDSHLGSAFVSLRLLSEHPFELSITVEAGYLSVAAPMRGLPIRRGQDDIGFYMVAIIETACDGGMRLGETDLHLRMHGTESDNPLFSWPRHCDPKLEAEILRAWVPVLEDLISKYAAGFEAFRVKSMAEIIRLQNEDIMEAWRGVRAMVARRDATRLALRRPGSKLDILPYRTPADNPDLRPFEDGNEDLQGLDEVVCEGVSMLHAETMSDDGLWIGATLLDGRRLAFNITGKKIVMRAEIDDDPAHDARS